MSPDVFIQIPGIIITTAIILHTGLLLVLRVFISF